MNFNSKNNFINLHTNLNSFNLNKTYDIPELKRFIVLEKLKGAIETVCYIISRSYLTNKLSAFGQIRNFLYLRQINYVKAELIFFNFQILIKNLLKIKTRFNKQKLLKHFSCWRLMTSFNAKFQFLKAEIKQSTSSVYRKKIEDSEKTKVQKEKENLKSTNEIAKNQETETNLISRVREFEDKELPILQNIQQLEIEKKLIEEEIKIFSKEKILGKFKNCDSHNMRREKRSKDKSLSPDKIYGNNSNDNNYWEVGKGKERSGSKIIFGKKEILIALERKISEYEKKISKLTEDNLSKDAEINLYMEEMNDLISKQEKICIF